MLIFCLSLCHVDHPEKRNKGLFHQITKTHGTVICVSTGVVLLLLILSILVQVKQPRKKVIRTGEHDYFNWREAFPLKILIYYLKVLIRKNNLFHRGDFQEVFDPPHYELFSLRDKVGYLYLLI